MYFLDLHHYYLYLHEDQVYFKFWMPRLLRQQCPNNSGNYQARMNMDALCKFDQDRIINTEVHVIINTTGYSTVGLSRMNDILLFCFCSNHFIFHST